MQGILIDRTEPTSFVSLPKELILTIFLSLPLADLANVSCVCSILRDLSSDPDFWWQKFVKSFGMARIKSRGIVMNWKEIFAEETKRRRRSEVKKKRRAAYSLSIPPRGRLDLFFIPTLAFMRRHGRPVQCVKGFHVYPSHPRLPRIAMWPYLYGFGIYQCSLVWGQ